MILILIQSVELGTTDRPDARPRQRRKKPLSTNGTAQPGARPAQHEEVRVTKGLFVRIEAKPGRDGELEEHLKAALAAVLEEPDTTVWLALRLGPTSFAVVDAFPHDAGRQFHLEAGKVRVTGNLSDLIAEPPTFTSTDIVAAKLPLQGEEPAP